eukprot:TRINITY_DN25210_c0_g1_i1.p1 TRINITY_DN25210_c0_g1~~TRINITY_DN25210_c0_g1_i1.p1  ORF type:complete len:168 (+),score=42.65 TRINITY_DN25210_c0_g1_i1:86-589(+)
MPATMHHRSWSDIKHLSCYDDDLPALARAIEVDCKQGDEGPGCTWTEFNASSASISVESYMVRLVKYFGVSPNVLFAAALRIARSHVQLSSRSVHRVLLAAVVVFAKLLEDDVPSNAFFAQVGGVSLAELNRLEGAFLKRTGFHLCCKGTHVGAFRAAVVTRFGSAD